MHGMAPVEATVKLVESKDGAPWSIQLMNFPEFDRLLGRDVLNGFCRCLIHAERLTSMASFGYISERHYGRDSVAFGRDLHTMVWFTIGTLRELAHGIRDLKAALAKKGILDPNTDAWKKLREVEERWDRDAFFRKARDKAAFHVDPDVVADGLAGLIKKRDVELSRGNNEKAVQTSLTLGSDALLGGLGWSLEEYRELLEKVSNDHGVAHDIQMAFIEAARAVGIKFGE